MSDTPVTTVPEVATPVEEPTPSQAQEVEEPSAEQATPDSPEGQQEEATPEEPKWESEYERWKEHPEFKDFIDTREQDARKQGQIREAGQRNQLWKHIDETAQTVIPEVRALNQTLQQIADSGGPGVAQAISQAFEKHAPALARYHSTFNESAIAKMKTNSSAEGIGSALMLLANQFELGSDANDLVRRVVEWENTGQTDANGNPILIAHASGEFQFDMSQDALKAFGKLIDKSLRAKGFTQGKKANDTAKTEGQKIANNDGKGPIERSGGASGNKDLTIENASTMPIAELKALRERQKAGG